MRRSFDWFSLALGIVLLSMLIAIQWRRFSYGENDFMGFYVGAKLAGTPDLYSRPANDAVISSVVGGPMQNVAYIRPPFYAVLLKPLAILPYRLAHAAFFLTAISSVLWFVVQFSTECPALPFFAATSMPVLWALSRGQDTPLLLIILGVSMLLTKQSRDFSAGLVLSLCTIKFHLFLFLPVLLLVKRRWRILGGAVYGTAILTGLGVLAAGADSMRQYVKILRDPSISPGATVMPNLHSLVASFHGDVRLEAALAVVVLLAFLWTAKRTENYELLFAASLVCGLLVSFHAYVADCVVLLPAFVSVVKNCPSAPLRIAAALILTPIPYFMLLAEAPYSAVFPILLLLLVGMFCTAGRVGEPFLRQASKPDPASLQLG